MCFLFLPYDLQFFISRPLRFIQVPPTLLYELRFFIFQPHVFSKRDGIPKTQNTRPDISKNREKDGTTIWAFLFFSIFRRIIGLFWLKAWIGWSIFENGY